MHEDIVAAFVGLDETVALLRVVEVHGANLAQFVFSSSNVLALCGEVSARRDGHESSAPARTKIKGLDTSHTKAPELPANRREYDLRRTAHQTGRERLLHPTEAGTVTQTRPNRASRNTAKLRSNSYFRSSLPLF